MNFSSLLVAALVIATLTTPAFAQNSSLPLPSNSVTIYTSVLMPKTNNGSNTGDSRQNPPPTQQGPNLGTFLPGYPARQVIGTSQRTALPNSVPSYLLRTNNQLGTPPRPVQLPTSQLMNIVQQLNRDLLPSLTASQRAIGVLTRSLALAPTEEAKAKILTDILIKFPNFSLELQNAALQYGMPADVVTNAMSTAMTNPLMLGSLAPPGAEAQGQNSPTQLQFSPPTAGIGSSGGGGGTASGG